MLLLVSSRRRRLRRSRRWASTSGAPRSRPATSTSSTSPTRAPARKWVLTGAGAGGCWRAWPGAAAAGCRQPMRGCVAAVPGTSRLDASGAWMPAAPAITCQPSFNFPSSIQQVVKSTKIEEIRLTILQNMMQFHPEAKEKLAFGSEATRIGARAPAPSCSSHGRRGWAVLCCQRAERSSRRQSLLPLSQRQRCPAPSSDPCPHTPPTCRARCSHDHARCGPHRAAGRAPRHPDAGGGARARERLALGAAGQHDRPARPAHRCALLLLGAAGHMRAVAASAALLVLGPPA